MGNIPKHTYRTMGNIPKPFRAFLLELSNHPRWHHPQLKGLYRKLPLYTSILWFLLGVLTFPCNVQCLIFKVGVLGPWDCDPLFSKALPNIAAQLAVDRANNDVSLDLGYKLDFVVLREDCETSTALSGFVGYEHSASAILGPLNPGYCDAATLLSKNWDKAIFSWACINYELDTVKSFPTFSRTLPSPTRVLFSLMKHFSLVNVGIVSSNEDVWVDTASRVADSLRNTGLPVGIVISLGYGPAGIEQTLQQIKSAGQLKIIIMCMHSVLIGGEEQAAFLVKANEMGLTDGRYVFLPYDTLLYSLPYKSNSFFMLGNNSQLREAYDSVLTITVESGESSFYEAFDKAKQQGEIKTLLQPEQNQLVKGPNKMVLCLEDLTFISPQMSKRVRLQQQGFKHSTGFFQLHNSNQINPLLIRCTEALRNVHFRHARRIMRAEPTGEAVDGISKGSGSALNHNASFW
ncbi:UNVERIFIED_CONTAM: hypothetical protein FKN15_043147 [Acipenser sinensis]